MEWQSSLFSQKPRKKSRTVVLTDSDDEKHKTSVGRYVLPVSSLALFVPLFSHPLLPLSSSLFFFPFPLFPTLSLFPLSIHPFSCIFSIFPFLSFPLAYFSPPCSLLSPASSVPLVHAQQLEHQEQLRKQLQESKSHNYHVTGWNLC